jgi:hypothetical protein
VHTTAKDALSKLKEHEGAAPAHEQLAEHTEDFAKHLKGGPDTSEGGQKEFGHAANVFYKHAEALTAQKHLANMSTEDLHKLRASGEASRASFKVDKGWKAAASAKNSSLPGNHRMASVGAERIIRRVEDELKSRGVKPEKKVGGKPIGEPEAAKPEAANPAEEEKAKAPISSSHHPNSKEAEAVSERLAEAKAGERIAHDLGEIHVSEKSTRFGINRSYALHDKEGNPIEGLKSSVYAGPGGLAEKVHEWKMNKKEEAAEKEKA